MKSTTRILAAAAASMMLLAGACSSDDSDDTTTTTEDDSGGSSSGGQSEQTKEYNEEIQKELAEVGCYQGADDGIVGPETDAAIVAFQTAEGLTPDGEVGPDTQAALTTAADAGTQVCDGSSPSTTSTTTPSGGTAPCTGTAIAAGLPSGETATSYVCSDGYAGVALSSGSGAILESEDGKWSDLGQEPCGAASAGLDPAILEKGCTGADGGDTGSTSTTAAS
ncbi:MAG: peptidoglycan-binding domain-containing protein [Microthrixaceae bacterium]